MVLLPQGRHAETVEPPANVQWRLEMAFNDDNGQRWHKYGSERIRKVSANFSLIIDG